MTASVTTSIGVGNVVASTTIETLTSITPTGSNKVLYALVGAGATSPGSPNSVKYASTAGTGGEAFTLLDSVRTYVPWLKRAGGHSPHVHPWSFYLQRLAWFHPVKGPVWSEGLILILAAVGLFLIYQGYFKKAPPQ